MIYVHTLCWNFPSVVEKSVQSLYELNDKNDFKHFVICLDFPLETDEIPKNLFDARMNNREAIKKIALKYGSQFYIWANAGVSGNWTTLYCILKADFDFSDNDCLIGADPDEMPQNKGWVKAIGDVLANSEYAICSLMLPEHLKVLNKENTTEFNIAGHRVWEIKGTLNWGLIGISGRFLNRVGKVPQDDRYPLYGNIESACIHEMKQLGMKWCVLPDYISEHTDYEKGSEGHSRLLREWKNHLIFSGKPQISLEEWLRLKV
jgi:hypothetical protein